MAFPASEAHKPETPRPLDSTERVRLMLDGIFNNVSPLVSGAVGVLLVPIMLRGLGAETYGLWIIALSLPGVVGVLDIGLGISVTLQVSGCRDFESSREAARFVASATNAHVAIGIVGAVIIAVAGMFSVRSVHLAAANARLVPAVVSLVALSFICEQVGGIEGEVLWGLRRFDLLNLIAAAATVLEFAGITGILLAGRGLLYVAVWHTAVAAGAAYASYATVARFAPAFRLRPGRIEWRVIRPNLRFSLLSQLAEAARNALWQWPPIAIGLILGSSSVVPYHVGRRIPQMVTTLYMRASAVLFPAVSEHAKGKNRAPIREFLAVGTRWITFWALPVCLLLWILAPTLLKAWIGNVPPGTTSVLRLITIAVFAEAIAAASIQVLWALGAMRTILAIPCSVVAVSLGCTMVLLPRIGITGVAWGLSAPMTVGAGAFLVIASQTCQVRVLNLLKSAFDGLLFPALALLVMSLSVKSVCGTRWSAVIAASVAGGLGYLIVFHFRGAKDEELMLARKLTAAPRATTYEAYRRLRHSLAKVSFLHSAYHLWLSIRDAATDSSASGRNELNREFERRADPWDYATGSFQQNRIRTEIGMLDAVRGHDRFPKALEVGCAEGMFTEVLAPRCESLLAVDISRVALARARQRLVGVDGVSFREFDLRIDPLPEAYDLIVVIHTLEYIRNPIYIHKIRTKLVDGLRPGGYLLIGTMKITEIHEDAWWGRYLLRSGKRINGFFAAHEKLHVVETNQFYLGRDYTSYDILLQKVA